MRQDDLNKDVYTNIHISDKMVDSLIADLNTGKRRSDMRFRYSTVIMALIIVSVVGFGSIGAGAAYMSYKSRIEEMTEEEQADYKQELAEDVYNCADEARTRSLTPEEWDRYMELEDEYYKNGVFPKDILPHVETLDEIAEDELAFVEEINKIHIPDAELTDEQLLQLIDHEAKYLYTIEQNAAELAEEEGEEEDPFVPEEEGYLSFDVTAADEQSIREQTIALIEEFYGVEIDESWNIDISGLDWTGVEELDEAWLFYEVTVTESEAPNATMYQLSLPVKEGGLFVINCSGKKYFAGQTEYTREQAEAYVDEGQQAVLAFVKEKFGLGTPDRIEIGGFENLDGDSLTSSTILYDLYYGEDYVAVEWNINNKQIYSVIGKGLL